MQQPPLTPPAIHASTHLPPAPELLAGAALLPPPAAPSPRTVPVAAGGPAEHTESKGKGLPVWIGSERAAHRLVQLKQQLEVLNRVAQEAVTV